MSHDPTHTTCVKNEACDSKHLGDFTHEGIGLRQRPQLMRHVTLGLGGGRKEGPGAPTRSAPSGGMSWLLPSGLSSWLGGSDFVADTLNFGSAGQVTTTALLAEGGYSYVYSARAANGEGEKEVSK